jgi:FkbM family methyltransferase
MTNNVISNFINQKKKELFKNKISDKIYLKNKKKIFNFSKKKFNQYRINKINISNIGLIKFPYFSFGKIKSYHLWDIEDLIIFSFYKNNKNNYCRALDLGANIGLHSIIFSKLGYKKVLSYEPDPNHFKQLKLNLKLNNCKSVHTINKAIFDKKKNLMFNRILGNTTGSHIIKMKKKPYGKIDIIKIKADKFLSLLNKKQKTIIKMDIEGAESKCILTTKRRHWGNTDAFIEITDFKSAKKIFKHLKRIRVNIFSHKSGWNLVSSLRQMPYSYKEGMIFVTNKIVNLKYN